ncbi:hypothetical protein [Streptomyces sp. WAC06614]|uniref:hypothetical protein n=1 Tax=Streptomyces sp. WAC06614 TaxID=2487416 RepID=UPI00163CA991|nr:hypothetical protein [Streptomyces sp. WAC06614]
MIQYIEQHDLGLRFTPGGGAGSADLGLISGAARAGDTTVGEPTFFAEHWEV